MAGDSRRGDGEKSQEQEERIDDSSREENGEEV
jgi:hypothetical protein